MVTAPDPHFTADPLDEKRREVLQNLLMDAAFDGWTADTLERAAADTGEGPAVSILFPQGVRDVLDFWAGEEDRLMTEAYGALDVRPEKIRDKVTWLVRRRIEQMTPHREAVRRGAATLALPVHAGLGPRLAWRTAGAIWQALGDSSTDGNWYTKRASLSAVYLSTLARWFADDGNGQGDPYAATWDFLDDRIGNVMQFEKLKAEMKKLPFDPASVAGFLGRLRYAAQK